MIKMKKYLTSILMIGTLAVGSTTVFAGIYGTVAIAGTGAYNANGHKVIEMDEGENINIVQVNADKPMYTVNVKGTWGLVEKENVLVRKVRSILEDENVKLRENPNPDAEIIKKLDAGEVVNALYKANNWYQVVLEDGTEGFIYKTQLQTDGLDLLPEETIDSRPIEILQWQQASRVLPRGEVAMIEDVYTGETFNIKRTFGTNHADVETLTQEDTVRMRQIWGGFSWERRPVIVHVKGRRLAASLAGMPHAGDSLDGVKGNGMSGVIDLHFRGSRKHKEGKISATPDPLHQAAITVAATYKR